MSKHKLSHPGTTVSKLNGNIPESAILSQHD
jgi:hypothetical protein